MHYGRAAAELETVDACGARMIKDVQFVVNRLQPTPNQMGDEPAPSFHAPLVSGRQQVDDGSDPSAQSRNDDV
jgi:hypothetical protein